MKINKLAIKLVAIISFMIAPFGVFGQKECKTIKEVRALENETEVLYTGVATTTFYGPGGILIQDETGYLYIKNGALAEVGNSAIRTNMKISNIYGMFKTANADEGEMTQIHVEFSEDLANIQIKEKNVSFTTTEVAINDLVANPQKYECQPIKLTDIEIFDMNNSKFIGNNKNKIPVVAGSGVSLPAHGTFEGYYGNYFSQGFVIPSAKQIISTTGYRYLLDFKEMYYDKNPNTELYLVAPVLVSYISKNTDGSAYVYAQHDDIWSTKGVVLHIQEFQDNIAVGDSIKNIKGMFCHFTNKSGKITGSKFNISAENGKLIEVINSGNKSKVFLIDDIEYVIGDGAMNYESIVCVTPKGTITKSNDKYILKKGTKSIFVEGIDFSQYEGKELALVGILDAGYINEGKISIILRNENDIVKTHYTFNSIAEMKEFGTPIATGTTYTLNCQAIVTHTHKWRVEDLNVYGFFIQDETAGLYIETNTKQDAVAGDLVDGIEGTYLDYLALAGGKKLNVVSSNHLDEIKYEEVTMETLATNPEKYASRVVKLMGVGHDTREENHYGEMMTIKYLYQGNYIMDYDIWDYELYEYNNIVGVFDYGSYQHFSIVPLSQNHIEEGKYISVDAEISSIEENIVFVSNEQIVAPNATNIKVFNINGQIVGETNNNTYSVSALPKGIFIVVATNETTTTTTKIINY